MARVVDTFVSVFGDITVRHFFRISCFLRPCGLPGLFVLTTAIWLDRFGRPAMRGCVDVDLRYRRLLDRRSRFRGAFTLSPFVAGLFDSAIRVAGHCRGAQGRAEDGGCLNVMPFDGYRAFSIRSAKASSSSIHAALGLLGTYQTGSQFPHSDHNWCRFLFGMQKRSTTVVIPGVVQHFAWNVV